MEPFTLQWAAAQLNVQLKGKDLKGKNATVTSICTDTRQIAPGALFFALKGEQADGHRYVAQALQNGAAGAVVSEEAEGISGPLLRVPDTRQALGDLAMQYRRQFPIPVVGITGSVGKTSTKEMAAAALRTRYRTLASAKNYNTEIGVPLTLFQLDKTHEVAVIEMGMRGLGQIDRLAGIAEPTIGLITNIGYAHIELLGSQQNIAQAKSEMLARLPHDGIAILPIQPGSSFGRRKVEPDRPGHVTLDTTVPQNELLAYLRSRTPDGCRILTYGNKTLDLSIIFDTFSLADTIDVSMWSLRELPDGGVEGLALVEGREYAFALHAAGSHNLANAQAALAVAYALDVPIPDALQALAEWQGAAGRMVVRKIEPDITVLDDCYNASPESMVAALTTLGQATGRSRVAVLGDMKELGDFAMAAHRLVGASVADLDLRLLVTVGPLAAALAAEAHSAASTQHRSLPDFRHFESSQAAAAEIHGLLRPGDTVLVKGARAMEMEKIVTALTGAEATEAHG